MGAAGRVVVDRVVVGQEAMAGAGAAVAPAGVEAAVAGTEGKLYSNFTRFDGVVNAGFTKAVLIPQAECLFWVIRPVLTAL